MFPVDSHSSSWRVKQEKKILSAYFASFDLVLWSGLKHVSGWQWQSDLTLGDMPHSSNYLRCMLMVETKKISLQHPGFYNSFCANWRCSFDQIPFKSNVISWFKLRSVTLQQRYARVHCILCSVKRVAKILQKQKENSLVIIMKVNLWFQLNVRCMFFAQACKISYLSWGWNKSAQSCRNVAAFNPRSFAVCSTEKNFVFLTPSEGSTDLIQRKQELIANCRTENLLHCSWWSQVMLWWLDDDVPTNLYEQS